MTSFPAGCCPTTHDAGPRSCRRRRSARSGLGRRHGNRTRPAALRLTGRRCLGAGARERSDNARPAAELSRSQTTSVQTVYETEQTRDRHECLHSPTSHYNPLIHHAAKHTASRGWPKKLRLTAHIFIFFIGIVFL